MRIPHSLPTARPQARAGLSLHPVCLPSSYNASWGVMWAGFVTPLIPVQGSVVLLGTVWSRDSSSAQASYLVPHHLMTGAFSKHCSKPQVLPRSCPALLDAESTAWAVTHHQVRGSKPPLLNKKQRTWPWGHGAFSLQLSHPLPNSEYC